MDFATFILRYNFPIIWIGVGFLFIAVVRFVWLLFVGFRAITRKYTLL